MKKYISILAAGLTAVFALASCEEDHSYEDLSDPVLSYYQLTGEWQLAEWRGEDMTSGDRYVYVSLESRDRTFNIYQNLDSAVPVHYSGTYELVYDEENGVNLVNGLYDHEFGFWNSDYIVRLQDEDTMVWTSAADDADISVYRRAEIPAGIAGE
ncbi:MAG: hypothetical protein ACI3ZC_01920 [Candidatus Cryptobacteroides sp.]